MSDAVSAVRQALAAALKLQPALAAVALYEADAPEGLLPRIELQEPVAADWSAKDWRGRELRTAVTIRVGPGQRERLEAMRNAAEAAGEAIARDLEGWRVASALFLRSRTVEERSGLRALLVEHRVRVVQV